MKTAISLPDGLFAEAERFAKRSAKSRSQLYAEAVAEYLARHAPNHVTESINRVCDQLDTRDDAKFAFAAARRTLGTEKW